MSMLAERKVKQKWSLNPRGTAWSEDSNKFGQKLLEKMGWSKGKGLGPNEDGMTNHVKVSYKNDSRGMGFKETNDQWTEHGENFDALLQSLSGAAPQNTEIITTSLEKKSQSSKVRVHYKKFTRGKDLSRCSEKDLANIFGKKSLKKMEEIVEEKEEIQEQGGSDNYYNGGSMLDYFRNKLPNYGKTGGFVVGSNGVLKRQSDSEEESRVGFGFEKKRKQEGDGMTGTPKKKKKEDENGLSNPAFDAFVNDIVVKKHVLNTIEEEDNEEQSEESGKKNENGHNEGNLKSPEKKKKNTVTGTPECKEIATKKKEFEENSTKKKLKKSMPVELSETPSKMLKLEDSLKKKKKKDNFGALDNPTFDENEETVSNTPTNLNYEIKRKKKKDSGAIDNPTFDENGTESNTPTNLNYEIKRKKKKDFGTIDNPTFDENEETVSNTSTNLNYEIKRKRKKDFRAIDNPTFDETDFSTPTNPSYEIKRKKKDKTPEISKTGASFDNPNFDGNDNYEVKRKKDKSMDNPSFDISDSVANSSSNDTFEVKRKKNKSVFDISDSVANSSSNDTFEVKRKKKKKRELEDESLAIDNPNFDSSNDCQNSYVDSAFEVKRKKKKKDVVAVDNPNFEDSKIEEALVEEPVFDFVLNVTNTPTTPKTPNKSSVGRRKSVRFSDVNEERIIPNNEDIDNRNDLFDINSRVIANGLKDIDLDDISKKLDSCQAEVENDINQAKYRKYSKYIGKVGNPNGGNEKLPEGTKLKFRFAKFGKSPSFMFKSTTSAKKSYKHLIKGDIILGFKNTNLHEIVGYGNQ